MTIIWKCLICTWLWMNCHSRKIKLCSPIVNPLSLMRFAIFGLSASVDIRQLPGAWVAELLGVVLEVQDHKKIKFQMATLGLKGLKVFSISTSFAGGMFYTYSQCTMGNSNLDSCALSLTQRGSAIQGYTENEGRKIALKVPNDQSGQQFQRVQISAFQNCNKQYIFTNMFSAWKTNWWRRDMIEKHCRPSFCSVMLCYEFLSRIASLVLRVNCYQRGSCVGGPSAFNSPFGHGSRSRNIRLLDNHVPGLSISLSSLVLSWVCRLPFWYDSAVNRTHNLPFWWQRLYHYITSR